MLYPSNASLKHVLRGIIVTTLFVSVTIILTSDILFSLGLWETSNASLSFINAIGFHPGAYGLTRYPWGILTYPWVHLSLVHLMINMLALWCVGGLFLKKYKSSALLSVYIGGGMLGAVVYQLAYSLSNALDISATYMPLYGSSANICAVSFALAVSSPQMRVRVPLIGYTRFVVVLLVLYSLITLTMETNWGGMLAHLGGAIYGILWGTMIGGGAKDYPTIGVEYVCSRYQLLKTKRYAKSAPQIKKTNPRDDDELDRILDKIKQSGYKSLSAEERRLLLQEHDKE